MNDFVACKGCGQILSKKAFKCPKCEQIVDKCAACGEVVLVHDLIAPFKRLPEVVFHDKCFKQIMEIPKGVSCNTCKKPLNSISPVDIANSPLCCPECGCHFRDFVPGFYQFCNRCHLAIFDFHKRVIGLSIDDGEIYFHELCSKHPDTKFYIDRYIKKHGAKKKKKGFWGF